MTQVQHHIMPQSNRSISQVIPHKRNSADSKNDLKVPSHTNCKIQKSFMAAYHRILTIFQSCSWVRNGQLQIIWPRWPAQRNQLEIEAKSQQSDNLQLLKTNSIDLRCCMAPPWLNQIRVHLFWLNSPKIISKFQHLQETKVLIKDLQKRVRLAILVSGHKIRTGRMVLDAQNLKMNSIKITRTVCVIDPLLNTWEPPIERREIANNKASLCVLRSRYRNTRRKCKS